MDRLDFKNEAKDILEGTVAPLDLKNLKAVLE